MLGQRGNRSEASPHIKRRDSGGEQEADRKQKQNDSSKAIQHTICSKHGNSHGQEAWPICLSKRNQRHANRLSLAKICYLKSRMHDRRIDLLQMNRRGQILRLLKYLTSGVEQFEEFPWDIEPRDIPGVGLRRDISDQ